jgi:hypothetical protein
MRPPAPRPESKSVTATPRAARSDAHTAPETAIGKRGFDRIRNPVATWVKFYIKGGLIWVAYFRLR